MTKRTDRHSDDVLPAPAFRRARRLSGKRRAPGAPGPRQHLQFVGTVVAIVLIGAALVYLSLARVDGSLASSALDTGRAAAPTTAPVFVAGTSVSTPTTRPRDDDAATTTTTIATSSTRVQRATERVSIANVAPTARIVGDLEGGAPGDTMRISVQVADANTLAGSRIELCVHRASVPCDARGDLGVRTARWSLVVTSGSPLITAADDNRGWNLSLRSRTGSASTQTATFAFELTAGTDTEGAGDWVLGATIIDDAGHSATVTGAPASIGVPARTQTTTLTDQVVSSIWPF